jgi:outer membrane protein W
MRRLLASVVLVASVLSAGAQEYGRGALNAGRDTSGLGRGPLPSAKYDGFASGGAWGLKLGLGWANVDWDLGPAGGSENLFVPQLSLSYKATDNLDVNFSTLFASAEDKDDQLGSTEADMTRLALGLRYWINTETRITPYVGGGLGYYLLDGKTDNTRENGTVVPATVSVKDAPGAFLEGGAAFQVSDTFFINADLTYDFLLGSADATINGDDEDFDVKSLSFNLGVTWMF